MRTARRSLLLLLLTLAACGQAPQAAQGDGWRWLATTAARDETFLWYLDDSDELADFWRAAEAGNPAPDVELPEIDFGNEFVLVLSTRGRGTEPGPCGVYFRGLRVAPGQRTLTVIFEPDSSQSECLASYVDGQYVVAVERTYVGEPPFDILIDEPGQFGQPAPLSVSP